LQVEGQAGLGIDQGGISTKDQAVEIRTLSAFYRRQIVCVRRRIYFAESVVGEALGITGDPRRIQSLISASRVRRRVDLAIRNRGLKALSIGLAGSRLQIQTAGRRIRKDIGKRGRSSGTDRHRARKGGADSLKKAAPSRSSIARLRPTFNENWLLV